MKCSLGIFTLALIFIAGWADELDVVNIGNGEEIRFAKVGDPLSVKCSVSLTDKDDLSLQWTTPVADDVDISARSELDAKTPKVYRILHIKSLKEEHFGKYSCSYKASSASFQLFAEEISGAVFNKSQSATLECNIFGEGLQELNMTSQWKTPNDNNKYCDNITYTIDKPERTDGGLYIRKFTFHDLNFTHDCNVPFVVAPWVDKFDKDKNIVEGDELKLECKVGGYPHEDVSWLKDDKDIFTVINPERMVLSSKNNYTNDSLVIKSVTEDDDGKYTCVVHSESLNRNDSKSLMVFVKDKFAAVWPFLGIVGEVVILCIVIFIYEKRRNKREQNQANNAQDADGSAIDRKEGLRHRNTQSNNATA